MTATTLKIDGMYRDGRAARIRSLLSKQAGVHEAAVSFADGAARGLSRSRLSLVPNNSL